MIYVLDGIKIEVSKKKIRSFRLRVSRNGKVPRFTLKMRAMKSLWGSCRRRSNVVFHELTHFLYANHGKNFYACILRFMPDYKERVKIMKN